MSTKVEGFDDRDWNGVLTPDLANHWKFVAIKVSQGRVWNPADRYVLQRQWARANKEYGLLRIPFHFWLPGSIGVDAEAYGISQAENFYNSMIEWNNPDVYGWGELPPCIDVESRYVGMSGPETRAKVLYYCLLKTEELWLDVPLIYTATWYWDKYMHSEFVKLVPEYWKKYDLYEADPLPNTTIAGWGDTNSIQQIILDGYYPGYGSGDIDLDETTQEWIDRRRKDNPPPPPPPADCEEAVEEAVAINQAANDVVISQKEDRIVELETGLIGIEGIARTLLDQ